MNEDMQTAVERVTKWVNYWTAKKGITDPDDVQDFMGTALEAVVAADRTFDPDAGMRRVVWLVQNAKWACFNLVRTYMAAQPEVVEEPDTVEASAEELRGTSLDYDSFSDDTYAPERVVEFEEAEAELERVLATLTEREQLVLRCTYNDNMTEREVAEATGITRSSVQRIRERALNKMRKRASEALSLRTQ